MRSTCKDFLGAPEDVQGKVEMPYLYILGQSSRSASDIDQLSYMLARIEDMQNVRQQNDKTIYIPWIFSRDGPAMQFEVGHQRGGGGVITVVSAEQDPRNIKIWNKRLI